MQEGKIKETWKRQKEIIFSSSNCFCDSNKAYSYAVKQRKVEALNPLATFQAISLLFVAETSNAGVRQI